MAPRNARRAIPHHLLRLGGVLMVLETVGPARP